MKGGLVITPAEVERFERFILESFPEGVTSREVRLSTEEAEHLKRKFPQVTMKEFSTSAYADGKVWFEVTL